MVEGTTPGNGVKCPLSTQRTGTSTELKMAAALSIEALAAAISSSASSADADLQLLLLDCRSFMDFDACHIRGSHNVYCPPIVKRRSGGHVSLESCVRNPSTRADLLRGRFDMVIVYDEDSETLDDVPTDSNTTLVLKSLRDEASVSQIYFLEGEWFRNDQINFSLAPPTSFKIWV